MYPVMREKIVSFAIVAIFFIGATPLAALGQQAAAAIPNASPLRPQATHHLDSAVEMTRASLDYIQKNVRDYTALFIKRNRVDGHLGEMTYAKLKIRHQSMHDGEVVVPMSVYLDFLKPQSVKGREVIWVEDQNDGKLIAHETGFRNVMNVKLDPTSYLAMRNQRYPITEIGIENLTKKILETAIRDRQHGECEVKFYRNAKVGDHLCDMIEVIHPVNREHFDFHRARVFFSHELNMPIRYASWSWSEKPDGKPVLEEEYTYLNVKVNVGLDDQDFDTSNPAYRFW